MKYFFIILISGFSSGLVSQNMCTDLNFELIAPGAYTTPTIPNWSIESQNLFGQTTACITPTVWVGGSNEFTLVGTPILGLAPIGNIPNSPLGGSVVAFMNNTVTNSNSTKITRSFSISPSSPFLTYALAFAAEKCSHNCCEKPRIEINFRNNIGAIIPCLSQTIVPECANNVTTSPTHAYSNWQTYSVNLATQPSTMVTLEVIVRDCNYNGHYMYALFDAVCAASGPPFNINYNASDNPLRVSWCAGTNTALISAPPGTSNYTWSVPPTASVLPASLNSTLLTVTNPSLNLTFTLLTLSNQGCLAATVYTLFYTNVNLNQAFTNVACGTQANGGATIQPIGSSAPYIVTWYSGGLPIGTGLSINNLTSGNYTVTVSSAAAGCGSATTVVFVPAFNQQLVASSNLLGLCSGQNTMVSVGSTPTLNTSNASFSWSPSTFLTSTNSVLVILSPSIAIGSSLSIIYTIAVTPTAAPQCVFTTTMALNLANPVPPAFSSPQVLCSSSPPFQVTATPAYQGFFTASPNNCMSAAGVFSPAVSSGSCTYLFTYSYAGCSASSSNSILVLSAPNLSISASSTNFCQGQTTTLNALGATQYTWSNAASGSTIVIAPPTSTVISVSASNSTGCAGTASTAITVWPLPNISVIPGQLCFKSQGLLTALGADSYSWSTGATGATLQPLVSIGLNTIQVAGTISATQCTNSTVHNFTVYNPLLNLSGDSVACRGAAYTFTASGCTSYTWNSSVVGSTYTAISNTVQNVTLIVLGESNGCSVKDSISMRIDECLGLRESDTEKNILFFPNPSTGFVQIMSPVGAELFIWDSSGRCLVYKVIHASVQETVLLQPGSYIAGVRTKEGIRYQQLSVLAR